MRFNTALLHKNNPSEKANGATLAPIYQVSAFVQGTAEQLEDVFNNRAAGFAYTRISNPTVAAFESRMSALEKGIGAVACSSGMTAVSMALMNILQSGDEIIASSALFGGTIDLFGDLAEFGVTTRFVGHVTADEIAPLINEKTKAIFAELIGNPNLEIVDLKAVAAVAHEHGIPLIIDSTTATPYLINPTDFGADIIVHSTSKYINGGGNSISGVIIDSGNFKWDFAKHQKLAKYKKFGQFAYLFSLRNGIWRNFGGCLAPMNAFMNSVGLETLGLRMERCCENALALAEFFESTESISVNYPALPESKSYRLCQNLLGGKGGAILTIRAGSKERAFRLINALKLAAIATNIGDVRTLIIHPASTIYAHSTAEQKISAGVFEDTIRISVGIEDKDDLIEDFAQAISTL